MTGNNQRDYRIAAKIRRRLSRAWKPFFSRFGGLTDVQLQTIPEILKGQNVVVVSPTASGKTEAVVAPVAQLHLNEEWPGLAVVYVVPTRALGNDMFERLEGSLGEMYLRVAIKHGDRPVLPSEELHWLITTPESLDSLICRKPELFRRLRTLILDEIHLLDGTYRGDQLRILLVRLHRLSEKGSVAVHLLSATLPNPKELALRYVDPFCLINVGKPRSVIPYLCQDLNEVVQLAKQKQWSKLLVFCNKRQSVEKVAGELQQLWHPYPVITHHGSLAREQREEAESVMKQNRVAACVSTSTLEIGIDIGNIDVVVLAEPPWSLESLQQRVGRANRLENEIHAAALYHSTEERELLGVLFQLAATGIYHANDYSPDRSVIVQQILSVLYQNRSGIPVQHMLSILQPLGSRMECESILSLIRDKQYCTMTRESVFPADELLDLGDMGTIHSNIPNEYELRVYDEATGRPIGQIRGTFDDSFLLGGKGWQVLKVSHSKVIVRKHIGDATAADFGVRRNVGRFHYWLPAVMRSSRQ